jgi:hypothetical protein
MATRRTRRETQAMAYGMGAILSQEGGPDMFITTLTQRHKPVLYPITYYSTTFTLTERNYDIYNQELLAITV